MKSNFVKNIYAQCLVYIMTCYKQNLISKTNQLLQETMKALLSDANGEVFLENLEKNVQKR